MSLFEQVEKMLSTRLVGQKHVIAPIVEAVMTAEASMVPDECCAGAFLLLGPTGVGKTETAMLTAEALHGSSKKMIRINCEEYVASHDVSKITGAPPGYVGHDTAQAVLRVNRLADVTSANCPFSIVLFDEFEKAHEDLHRLILGMVEGPTLETNGKSITNFHNTFFFFTSNLGSKNHTADIDSRMGFVPNTSKRVGRSDSIYQVAARHFFPSELLGRLDAKLVYHALSPDELLTLVRQELDKVAYRVRRPEFELVVDPALQQWLANTADTARYGGRDIRTTVHRYITVPLARELAAGNTGSFASVTMVDGAPKLILGEKDELKVA